VSGTTPKGLPYPDPADPISDGADAIRALAETFDGLTDIVTAGFFTPAAGWTISGGMFARLAFATVQVQIGLQYGGAAVSVPANGNLADTIVGTIAVGWRPAFNAALTACGGGPVVAARVTAAGSLAITAVAPGTVFDSNFGTTLGGVWPALSVVPKLAASAVAPLVVTK